MKKLIPILLLLSIAQASTAITYTGRIKSLQGEGLNDAYNTVHLYNDVTQSPCADTNRVNRFNIINEVQQGMALAALISGREITLMPSGKCNAADIETVNFIKIDAD